MKHALTIKQSLFFTDLSIEGNSGPFFLRALDIKYQLRNFVYDDGRLSWNFDDDADFNQAILRERTLFQAVYHFIFSLEKAIDYLTTKVQQLQKSLNPAKLAVADRSHLEYLLDSYLEAYLINMPFLFMFWNIEHLLFSRLKPDIAAIAGSSNTEEYFRILLQPSRPTTFAKERQSLQKMCGHVAGEASLLKLFSQTPPNHIEARLKQVSPSLLKYINKHVHQFAFTTTAVHLGEPLTTLNVIERLKENLETNSFNKMIENGPHEVAERKQAGALLRSLRHFNDVTEGVDLARDLMFWKNQRLDTLFASDWQVHSLFQRIASIIGIGFRDFVFLSHKEVKIGLRTGRPPVSINELEQRRHSYKLVLREGNREIGTGNSLDFQNSQEAKADSSEILSDTVVLTGVPAYPGRVQGRVRIALTTEDARCAQKGEVLVTAMTRPEMVIGLERAAAFVTDEGGMLCHAAIVSREMRKPCITGTHHATRLLRDGQLIEVDADQGVVRLLES